MIKKLLTALLIVCLAFCFFGCNGVTHNGTQNNGTHTEDSVDGEQGDGTEGTGEEITRGDGIFTELAAVDFDGNIVDSSVFNGYKVTMINVWATWCNPCKQEMPALAELNDEYKDLRVIGVAYDAADKNYNRNESAFNSALNIISQTNASYMHLIPSKKMKSFLDGIKSVPVTVFVDEDGYQLGPIYSGSKTKQEWKKIIDDIIAFVNENS